MGTEFNSHNSQLKTNTTLPDYKIDQTQTPSPNLHNLFLIIQPFTNQETFQTLFNISQNPHYNSKLIQTLPACGNPFNSRNIPKLWLTLPNHMQALLTHTIID